MRRLYATQVCCSLFFSMTFSTQAYAVGEILIDKLLRSDFIYDRDVTNMPFIPLGYLTASNQSDLQIEKCPLAEQENCEFDYQSLNQGAGLPVWVGQKHMVVLAETLDVDRFSSPNGSTTINTGGLMAAWASQFSTTWQSAAFLYYYHHLDSGNRNENANGVIGGFVGRYRHGADFHSYWGAVQADAGDETLIYPYVGFDWFINKYWSVVAIIPWPSINYSPNEHQIFKLGALVSGTSWSLQQDDTFSAQDFSQVSVGFSFEQKLSSTLWGEVSVGYTGLGKLEVETDADSSLSTDISNEPFFRLALNARPF